MSAINKLTYGPPSQIKKQMYVGVGGGGGGGLGGGGYWEATGRLGCTVVGVWAVLLTA